VLTTPGHTDDSVSLLLTGGRQARLLTGDTVLGRGSTVIAAPDGDLGDYLTSLQRLLAVVAERDVAEILPGHGPVITRPGEVLGRYLTHRQERLQQVRDAVAAGASSAEEVVRAVYADVDPSLWPAATQSVLAQLRHLGVDD
jgi:glyoxylase-like metal-dependent hydrolase (beta-lactamase superfamily II)